MYGREATPDPAKCCGCGACAHVCPKQCIRMVEDEDGFVFPRVDAGACVNCGRCDQVCPFERKPELTGRVQPVIFAARQKSEDALAAAASGGAFAGIAAALAADREDADWWVWGAVLDERLQVRHQCRRLSEGLEPFHKSKYVQSDLGDALPRIQAQLRSGEHVLFSGTPCQVAALRNYLGPNVPEGRLFCVDLVCHGVPPQKLFDRYVAEEGQALKSPVTKVEFRHKVYRGKNKDWDSRNLRLTLADGRAVIRNRYQSRFLRGYHAFLFYRDSCHKCPFASDVRNGDVTLADFWGVEHFLPEVKSGMGISLIRVNTRAGERVMSRLDQAMDVYPVDRTKYMNRTTGAMVQPSPVNLKRGAFFRAAKKSSFFRAVDDTIPAWKEWGKIEVMRRLSPQARTKLKRLLHISKSSTKG